MSESKSIVLYDIPSTVDGVAWSPNVWKTRFCLNYKGLPHRTVWVEYPDIADTCKSLGVAPTSFKRSGEPYYTVPFIIDEYTGVSVSDSLSIAKYLDHTYPDTPRVMPEGTATLQAAYATAWDNHTGACARFVVSETYRILQPASQVFFKASRESSFKMTMEEMMPLGEDAKKLWTEYEAGLGKIAKWYPKEDVWAMGSVPSFADFVAGGEILWIRILWGEESQVWKMIASWEDGRWAKLEKALRTYGAVH